MSWIDHSRGGARGQDCTAEFALAGCVLINTGRNGVFQVFADRLDCSLGKSVSVSRRFELDRELGFDVYCCSLELSWFMTFREVAGVLRGHARLL